MKTYFISNELKNLIGIDRIFGRKNGTPFNPFAKIDNSDELGLISMAITHVEDLLERKFKNYQKQNLHQPLYEKELFDAWNELTNFKKQHEA